MAKEKMTLENHENILSANEKDEFLFSAVAIVETGRRTAYASVNQAMIATYWRLGRHIVEFEQDGEKRADYGKEILGKLAVLLTEKFGKNFSARNLRYHR